MYLLMCNDILWFFLIGWSQWIGLLNYEISKFITSSNICLESRLFGHNFRLNPLKFSPQLRLQWKFKLLAEKFTWVNKAKHCWVISTNFLYSKVCWRPAMFCLYTSSKLSPAIWIFTLCEGDGIESRLPPFTIFSTLQAGSPNWY